MGMDTVLAMYIQQCSHPWEPSNPDLYFFTSIAHVTWMNQPSTWHSPGTGGVLSHPETNHQHNSLIIGTQLFCHSLLESHHYHISNDYFKGWCSSVEKHLNSKRNIYLS